MDIKYLKKKKIKGFKRVKSYGFTENFIPVKIEKNIKLTIHLISMDYELL